MIELSDTEIEASREPLEETSEFIDSLEAVCVKNVGQLSTIGGNVLIAISGLGAWTLVIRGASPGFYPMATDDEVDFAIACEEWVLHELLDPEFEGDLGEYAEAGVFTAEGDYTVFQRLITLAQGGGGNAVNVRFRDFL